MARTYIKLFGVTALAALITIGGIWYFKREKPDEHGFLPAAPFELQDSSGKIHRLADFKGKFVILHFWASWCAPCIEEIPKLVEFARRFMDKPVQVVAVSLDEKWQDALSVLPEKDLPLNLTSLIDVEHKLPDRYGSYQYPETYLINPEQRVMTKWVGPQDWVSEATISAAERTLTDRPGRSH